MERLCPLRMVLLLLLVPWVLLCPQALGIKCPPCHKIHCSPKRASKLQCKGGVTTGVCGCCPVCAKLEGEACGGDFVYLGRCDRGLECLPGPGTSPVISRVHTLQVEQVGVCTTVPRKKSRTRQADAAFVEFCGPKCSLDFCRKRPRAICSASEVADTLVECQGACQHTSCRACRVLEDPACPACVPGDTACIKQFGRCMHKLTCSNKDVFCSSSKQPNLYGAGKFVCKVPGCL